MGPNMKVIFSAKLNDVQVGRVRKMAASIHACVYVPLANENRNES